MVNNERFVFPGMRAQIARDKVKYPAKCEKNRVSVQQRRNTAEEKAAPSDTNEYERTVPYTNEYDRTETYTNDTKGKDKDKDRDKGEGRDRDAYAPVRETARRFRAPVVREAYVYVSV